MASNDRAPLVGGSSAAAARKAGYASLDVCDDPQADGKGDAYATSTPPPPPPFPTFAPFSTWSNLMFNWYVMCNAAARVRG